MWNDAQGKWSFTWELHSDSRYDEVEKKDNVHINLQIILKRLQMETIYFSNIHI